MNTDFLKTEKYKLIGFECLILVLANVVGVAAMYLQMLGRTFIDRTDSFLFWSDNYQYNYVAYATGWVLFLAYLIVSYIFLLRRPMIWMKNYGAGCKILYVFLALFFCFIMIFVLVLFMFFKLGLTENMLPENLLLVTIYGFPISTDVLLIGAMLYNQFS